MLVLTRKLGERLVIGGNIVVKIVDVQGDKVRIGIEAPKEVPVHREEVFRRMDSSRSLDDFERVTLQRTGLETHPTFSTTPT